MSATRAPLRTPLPSHSLADWRAAVERHCEHVTAKPRELRFAPCPACGGGTKDTGWARIGRSGIVAGCNGGCGFEDLARALWPPERQGFGRMARTAAGRGGKRGPARPKTRPRGERASEAITGRSGGRAAPNRPKSGSPAESEAVESPVSDERHPPKGRGRAEKIEWARDLWRRGVPVPTDPRHPARLWAATKERGPLWPPGDPFPRAVRWLDAKSISDALPWWRGPTDGALCAALRPLGCGGQVQAVTMVHVRTDGRPGLGKPDRTGKRIDKRSLAPMTGAAVTFRWDDSGSGVHVCEGLADALAVAARQTGAVVAVLSSSLSRIADPLAEHGAPVVAWPDRNDRDGAGLVAAHKLVTTLVGRGRIARLARVPSGFDPASMAGPTFDGDTKWQT